MALLNSRSSRFERSFDHMLSRHTSPETHARKKAISMVVPATHNRRPEEKRKGCPDDRS